MSKPKTVISVLESPNQDTQAFSNEDPYINYNISVWPEHSVYPYSIGVQLHSARRDGFVSLYSNGELIYFSTTEAYQDFLDIQLSKLLEFESKMKRAPEVVSEEDGVTIFKVADEDIQ